MGHPPTLLILSQFMELIIDPPKGHQFFMGPSLADSAVVHDQNLVGIPNGGKSVGHNQRGPIGSHLRNSVLDKPFGFRVHTGRGG